MKKILSFLISFVMALYFGIVCFAWGDPNVTVPVRQYNVSPTESRILLVIIIASAALIVSIGVILSLKRKYPDDDSDKK